MKMHEYKQKESSLFLINAGIITALSLVGITIIKSRYISIDLGIYYFFKALLLIAIQALLIFFFYKEKQYKMKKFTYTSLFFLFVALVMTILYFLQYIFSSLRYQELFDIVSDITYIFKFYIVYNLIYQLPFIVLVSAFLLEPKNKFMFIVSFFALLISTNLVLMTVYNWFHSIGYIFTIKDINDYVFYFSILLFIAGLYIEHNKTKQASEENLQDLDYVYPYEENRTITRYLSYLGRASISEYWLFVIVNSVVLNILVIYEASTGAHPIVILLTFAFFAYTAFCMNMKRLHDVGLSGWYQVVGLIPVIGWFLLFWKYVQVSQPFDNIYGKKSKIELLE